MPGNISADERGAIFARRFADILADIDSVFTSALRSEEIEDVRRIIRHVNGAVDLDRVQGPDIERTTAQEGAEGRIVLAGAQVVLAGQAVELLAGEQIVAGVPGTRLGNELRAGEDVAGHRIQQLLQATVGMGFAHADRFLDDLPWCLSGAALRPPRPLLQTRLADFLVAVDPLVGWLPGDVEPFRQLRDGIAVQQEIFDDTLLLFAHGKTYPGLQSWRIPRASGHLLS